MRAPLARVFARREPHDVRILWIDCDAAERERAPLVEYWRKRHAAIDGLPQAAERARDVPDVWIFRIDLHVLNASRRQPRADAAKLEALQLVAALAAQGGAQQHHCEKDVAQPFRAAVPHAGRPEGLRYNMLHRRSCSLSNAPTSW